MRYDRIRRAFKITHNLTWIDYSSMPSVFASQLMAIHIDVFRRSHAASEWQKATQNARMLASRTYGRCELAGCYTALMDEASAFLRTMALLERRVFEPDVFHLILLSFGQKTNDNVDDKLVKDITLLLESEIPLGMRME